MTQEDLRQLDTHAPSAGELRTGAVKILALETQTDDRPVHLRDETCLIPVTRNL